MLDFRILGPLEVVGENGPIGLGGLKQRATLAILLLSANRVVSVERLADDLYAGAPPVTAVTQVQRQISDLRKLLTPAVIETRAPGYVVRLAPERLDLNRFERLTDEATQALAQTEAETAARLLGAALGLWRGAPLADLVYESFAQVAIDRLEEIHLAAIELRLDAELALGRHAALIGELESLVRDHPLRERLRGQLMLALYRSGRQADALNAYRKGRDVLVESFGIEPTPALHELERAILIQDPSLELPAERATPRRVAEADRGLLVLPSADDRIEGLLVIAERLARLPGRDVIVARLLPDDTKLAETTSALNLRRSTLTIRARTAAFTTLDPARDAVRLATTYGVDLVLLDAPDDLDATLIPDSLLSIFIHSQADVGVLAGPVIDWERDGIAIPFAGGEHDWAALEVGAWLASAAPMPIRLIGTKADAGRGRRDASRLLADASLAVQRVVGVDVEPVLAEPDKAGLVTAVVGSALIVTGVSPRWRNDGIGAARGLLVRSGDAPVLFVHSGPRPGGLAPRQSRTRFTWSIAG